MIENREKDVGRSIFVAEFLKVVDQEHVHLLKPVEKVGNLLVDCGVSHQILKLTQTYEQHFGFWIPFLDAYTYRLDKVGLAHADLTIKEEWVEIMLSGIIGDIFGNCERQTVAFAHTIILECKRFVELWIKIRSIVGGRIPQRRGILHRAHELVFDHMALLGAGQDHV